MVAKVKQWRAAGIPIDGIGSQAHLQPGQAAGFKAALKVLCSAVPECAVTELDIVNAKPEEYAMVAKVRLQCAWIKKPLQCLYLPLCLFMYLLLSEGLLRTVSPVLGLR